jgi:glycosyltransferase involved in cell wall biosynthesis
VKNILYIGNKLTKHGFNQTSIETLGPLLEKEGFRVSYASSSLSKTRRMCEMIWKTISQSYRTDYVLIDTYSTQNFWYAFVISQLCRLLRLKYIPKLHGGDLPKRLVKNPNICRMIFAHAYVNIAPSGYLFTAFKNAGFKRLLYIPNSIDICNYEFRGYRPLKPRLLWVRSFSPIYNPEMALVVLSELKKEFPDATLCMVGPDKNNMLDKLRQLAQELDIDVTFTGKLTKKEWTELSLDYDVFINTTHFDNTPVSVIEAMALGLPVVSTNVGGIPFLLEARKTALLVNDNDIDHMVTCIKELLRDESLKDFLVTNALALVQEFDSEKVKWKWLEILV